MKKKGGRGDLEQVEALSSTLRLVQLDLSLFIMTGIPHSRPV